MSVDVENISINVKTNAGDAAKQFRSLSSALSGVRGSAKSVASGGAHKSIARIGSAAKSSAGMMGKLFNSIKRIAMYRLIRTAMREITQAFAEGLKNAYNFSKGISGTLAAALDTISTKSLTMKNQLGAALGGLLTAIAPILLRIIELVRAAAQALSALFSALGGGQYLIATDVAKSWDQATGAAKRYKNTILGFDEINRLDEPSGGGGGSVVDASKMFEVGELPGWAQSVANVFESIRGKIREFIDQLNFEPINKSLGELWQSVSRLADTIGRALGWAWNNILVPLGKWTIEEAAPRVVEALAAAFDFLDSVLNALAPILEPLWENVLRPFFEWLGNIVLTGLDGLIDLLKDLTKLVNGEISFKEFVQGLDDVKVALLALGGFAVLSGIGKLGTGVATAFTTAVGAARTGAAKLEVALLNGAKWVAVGALAVTDAVLVAYDVQTLNEANKVYSEALSAHGKEINNALRLYKQLYDEKGKEVADSWAAMVYQVDTTGMTLDESQKALCQKIDSYWKDVPQDLWEGFVAGWKYYFGPGGTKLDGLLIDAFNNAVNGVKKLLGIQSPSTVFYDIGSNMVQGLWNGFKEKWDSFLLEIQGWWRNLKQWWGGLSLGNITGGVSIAGASSSPHFSGKFASGGMIENTGSLFLAGEAGPEIVANMGSKTGVMNVDQMEAAVANGNSAVVGAVYAMANAIVAAIESKDTDISIDGESLARRLYKPMRDVSNQRGASLVMA